MEVQVQLHDRTGQEVCLLPEWHAREDASRWGVAGITSVLLHIAGVLALVFLPLASESPGGLHISEGFERSTPLIAPPRELTQTAPNREKVGKEFTLESLLPKPRIFIPPSPPSTALPAPAARERPLAIPEPPKIDAPQAVAQLPAPGVPSAPPPPQIQAQERPRIVLETPGSPGGAGTSTGQPKLKAPSTSVDEAARDISRGRAAGGSVIVSDFGDMGGIGEGLNLPPSPGKIGSTLELLSDPMGVDFHPYLVRILATVKRNWWAVIPESARMGRQGRVAIVFAINRDGQVPKLVIATPSGTDALDRAAVAGISASNPFPPLPSDFQGQQIRLQFTFLYNMRAN